MPYIIESPESVLKTTSTHGAATQTFGSDVDSAAIANKGRGNFAFVVDHEATSTSTIVITVIHADTSGGSYTIATDQAGNNITYTVPTSAAAGVARIRARADGLKAYVKLRINVTTANRILSAIAIQSGLDSDDCDGAAGYDFLA